MALVSRKPVLFRENLSSGFVNQFMLKPACLGTEKEASQNIEILCVACLPGRITKTLSAVAQLVEILTRGRRVVSLRSTHRRHCVVSLSKTLYPLLSTGSILEQEIIPT